MSIINITINEATTEQLAALAGLKPLPDQAASEATNDLLGTIKELQFKLREVAEARQDALKTAHAAAGRLADIGEAIGFMGNPGDLVAEVRTLVRERREEVIEGAGLLNRVAQLEAELKRVYDAAGIPAEQRLATDTPSTSGVAACSLPEEAPAAAAVSSPDDTPAPSADAPSTPPDVSEATGLRVGESEELTAPSGKRVLLTRLSNAAGYLEHYSVTTPRKREVGTLGCIVSRGTWGAVVGAAGSAGYATHLEALNWLYRQDKHTAGEDSPSETHQVDEQTHQLEEKTQELGPAPLAFAEAAKAQGLEEWTAPLGRGARVKVDTVGFTGYGIIVQQARIGQNVKEADGYVVETQSGKRVMALWSACLEAPLPPVEEPTVEAPAAEEHQIDAELAELLAKLEQMPAATLTPDEPVVILIEDTKRLASGVIVRQFEGSSRYTIKKDGGGMEVVDASHIRRNIGQLVSPADIPLAPAPAADDTPPWEGEVEPDDAGDGDRLVTPEERAELGAFAKRLGVVPARISALIQQHFSKSHSSELTVSELGELRKHIEAEAAAHVF